MENLAQILMLLGVAVAVVLTFQRLHIPTSLGYLLVGVILGPYTVGPTINVPEFKVLAEFGVVFLLFTIGLNYSLPQLHALRHQVLGLGTAQVAFTTAAVALLPVSYTHLDVYKRQLYRRGCIGRTLHGAASPDAAGGRGRDADCGWSARKSGKQPPASTVGWTAAKGGHRPCVGLAPRFSGAG